MPSLSMLPVSFVLLLFCHDTKCLQQLLPTIFFRSQHGVVGGRVMCAFPLGDNIFVHAPAGGAEVQLYEKDMVGNDDLLNSTIADRDGTFELLFQQYEPWPLEPYLRLSSPCVFPGDPSADSNILQTRCLFVDKLQLNQEAMLARSEDGLFANASSLDPHIYMDTAQIVCR